ncbi:unnamed protein product, partial [Choristocarpus tenellus]
QILLLSKQNLSLRSGIDSVEAELTQLHGAIESKDVCIQRQKREVDRLKRDIKRLQVDIEESKGRKHAMEVAATQNTRLLKLLEQEEYKREEVLLERDAALAELGELKARLKVSDEKFAKQEAGMQVNLFKALGENKALIKK